MWMTFALFSPTISNMASAAILRLQVERDLANRVPAALTPKIRQTPDLFPTGLVDLDVILGGGIPRGCITELSGETSSGKTSFALSTIGSITRSGAACAWIDINDALSPESAAAANIQLKRLLWLRMTDKSRSTQHMQARPLSRLEQAIKATDLLLQAGGFSAIVLDMSDVQAQHTSRIPLSHWYRFRLAAEQSRSALIFLTQSPCASSCASLVLRCESADTERFSHDGETALFSHRRYVLVRERNRNEGPLLPFKKPSSRAIWEANTSWCGVR